ncbi:aldo/keto reductase [Umbelopsis sp. AD052]|nr:aldo/keto reductase [Umbelopsis sp. AD052]
MLQRRPSFHPLPQTIEVAPTLYFPRLLVGLWSLSSNRWNEPVAEHAVINDLRQYYQNGMVGFDMADIYGPAEKIYGSFIESLKTNPPSSHLSSHLPQPVSMTKFVPRPGNMSMEVVKAAVEASLSRMKVDYIDLIQFHWWDYSDKRYLDAVANLHELTKQNEPLVRHIGLTNFDSERLEEICSKVPNIRTNQVQFSIIDTRPEGKMRKVCERYNVKLLTYGTFCGGLLSEKYIGQPTPQNLTPSQEKYLQSILQWGSWDLFQELLQLLNAIANKHQCTIANVASKYVLRQPHVAAVIVGARFGVAQHIEENWKSLECNLSDEDLEKIQSVQQKGRKLEDIVGDCGDEYR